MIMEEIKQTVEEYIKECNYTHAFEDIVEYYEDYYVKGYYVSHTTKDVIKNALEPAIVKLLTNPLHLNKVGDK